MARMVLTFHVAILRCFLSLSVGLDFRASTRGPGAYIESVHENFDRAQHQPIRTHRLAVFIVGMIKLALFTIEDLFTVSYLYKLKWLNSRQIY